MERRDFARLAGIMLAGGVFVPSYGRWFQRFGGLWSPEPEVKALYLPASAHDLNRIWRKAQGQPIVGYDGSIHNPWLQSRVS